MEATFITIHDLTPEARILYCSDSIIDVLGYAPEEVVNRDAWDFFHPDELPIARAKHGKGIEMDKAAMLSYGRMRGKNGEWIGCEIVFTVTYDCLVGCTSVYRNGSRSQSRAADAPPIRRLFSNSPRDPRYHMLSHLSTKFTGAQKRENLEPRAALFLNRYTRTLTIMYATDGLSDVLGISGDELRGRSFYFCIQENCLQDAVRCLESAKANDSIAYLRFWYRDPRQDEQAQTARRGRAGPPDHPMEDVRSSDEDTETGTTPFEDDMNYRSNSDQMLSISDNSRAVSSSESAEPATAQQRGSKAQEAESRTSSHDSNAQDSHEAVFGQPQERDSSMSSQSESPGARFTSRTPPQQIELEAVVSCGSDGLVVTLRRARPLHPQAMQMAKQTQSAGLFAVPWSPDPILPPIQQRMQYAQAPSLPPDQSPASVQQNRMDPHVSSSKNDFMNTIRDIAVFAWALVGINGSLAEYGRGTPSGTAQPPSGLSIWKPDAREQERAGYTSYGDTLIQGIQPSTAHFENNYNKGINNNGVLYSSAATNGGNVFDTNGRNPTGKDPFGDPGLSRPSRWT